MVDAAGTSFAAAIRRSYLAWGTWTGRSSCAVAIKISFAQRLALRGQRPLVLRRLASAKPCKIGSRIFQAEQPDDMFQPVGGFTHDLAAHAQDFANDIDRLLPLLHTGRQQRRNSSERSLFIDQQDEMLLPDQGFEFCQSQASEVVGSQTNSSNKLEGSFVDRASPAHSDIQRAAHQASSQSALADL